MLGGPAKEYKTYEFPVEVNYGGGVLWQGSKSPPDLRGMGYFSLIDGWVYSTEKTSSINSYSLD